MKLDVTDDELTALYVAIGYALEKDVFKNQNEQLKNASLLIAGTLDELMEENRLLNDTKCDT